MLVSEFCSVEIPSVVAQTNRFFVHSAQYRWELGGATHIAFDQGTR